MIISGASGTVDPTANRAMDIQPYSMLLEYSQFHRGRKTSNDEKSRMIDLCKFVITAQTGRSFQVARGEYIRVIDPEGQQVADLWALTTDGEIDWLSTSQTRDITERLFPSIGESFYSYNAKPMLTLVEDESSGPHDMLFPACNHDLYVRAGLHEHPNCRDNLLTALRNENIRLPVVPDPVNFFQNSPPKPDGRLDVLASLNLPGGYVVLRAEQDLTLVITACSIDFHPTNGGICTPIEIEISQTPFSVVP